MPRGGRRTGAGRKPKPQLQQEIQGNTGHRAPARVLSHPSASVDTTPEPVEEFDAPDYLTTAGRHVWLQEAGHAFAARTLTKATMAAFVLLCEQIALERSLNLSSAVGGSDHRGVMQRVAAGRKDFMIAPNGKPLIAAKVERAVNPLDRYRKA